MIGALLATGVWSLSGFASSRGSRHLGGISANLVRAGVALPLLVLLAVVWGLQPWLVLGQPGAAWFLWSGIVGIGVGDILVLAAYPRLGTRVTSLIVNAAAAPVAAVADWLWLGAHPGLGQGLAILAILAGVILVLRPRAGDRADAIGVLCALAGAVGFALSAVMSRVGFAAATAAGRPMHWLDSTVLRVGAGVVLCAVAFALAGMVARSWRDGPGRWRQALPWLALNATLGPGLGLVCYQWALTATPAAEVHAVVAVVPVAILVLSWAFGEDRPDLLSVVGTVVAVAGVIALGLSPLP